MLSTVTKLCTWFTRSPEYMEFTSTRPLLSTGSVGAGVHTSYLVILLKTSTIWCKILTVENFDESGLGKF